MIVANAEVAAVGTVSDVAAGWGIPEARVRSLVELKLATIVTNSSRLELKAGDRITFIQDSGELRIQGRYARSSDYPGFTRVGTARQNPSHR
jgi:hypothetical protein